MVKFQDSVVRNVTRIGMFGPEKSEVTIRSHIPHGVGCLAIDMALCLVKEAAFLTPDEIVQRSCDTAQKMYEELHQRGWMLEIDRSEE